MIEAFTQIFTEPVQLINNTILIGQKEKIPVNQTQTQQAFSDKWAEVERFKSREKLYKFQFDWFLKLYGFESEKILAEFLSKCKYIIDTGCGLGYKSAWFAKLAPRAMVIGIDISDAVDIAARNYAGISNLYFLKADIANTKIKPDSIDFVICDQVIMHTEIPEKTFAHLSSITSKNGEFACYVYSRKALPRELIDDYFRKVTHEVDKSDMWRLSEQLTELGKRLSELNVQFESPDIPLLGIKGGKYDIQRFIYWNFLKCFWRADWGYELCTSTNYDWYAPSNAKRFSKDEFLHLVRENNLQVKYFHEEEACYSGRFVKS